MFNLNDVLLLSRRASWLQMCKSWAGLWGVAWKDWSWTTEEGESVDLRQMLPAAALRCSSASIGSARLAPGWAELSAEPCHLIVESSPRSHPCSYSPHFARWSPPVGLQEPNQEPGPWYQHLVPQSGPLGDIPLHQCHGPTWWCAARRTQNPQCSASEEPAPELRASAVARQQASGGLLETSYPQSQESAPFSSWGLLLMMLKTWLTLGVKDLGFYLWRWGSRVLPRRCGTFGWTFFFILLRKGEALHDGTHLRVLHGEGAKPGRPLLDRAPVAILAIIALQIITGTGRAELICIQDHAAAVTEAVRLDVGQVELSAAGDFNRYRVRDLQLVLGVPFGAPVEVEETPSHAHLIQASELSCWHPFPPVSLVFFLLPDAILLLVFFHQVEHTVPKISLRSTTEAPMFSQVSDFSIQRQSGFCTSRMD